MTDAATNSGPRHRGGRRRRGIAAWVWVTPLTILVIIGLVLGWLALTRDSRDAPDSSTTTCLAGELTLTIWADPAAEEVARELAESYWATSPVVRDYCVRPQVELKDGLAAITAYRSAMPGAAAVWLPVTTDTGTEPGIDTDIDAGTIPEVRAGIGAEQISELPGAPADPPVVAKTSEGSAIPLVVFGSSPAVSEDLARAGADMLHTIASSETEKQP